MQIDAAVLEIHYLELSANAIGCITEIVVKGVSKHRFRKCFLDCFLQILSFESEKSDFHFFNVLTPQMKGRVKSGAHFGIVGKHIPDFLIPVH